MASAWHIFPCLNISIIGLIVLCLVTKLAANELSSLPILKPTWDALKAKQSLLPSPIKAT